MLVAPYYGAGRNNHRAGYRPEFVERVRHCEYPQFVWDHLPFAGGEESILRLDHLQPIGARYAAYKLSGFRLKDTAVEVIDELLSWLVWGGVTPDSLVANVSPRNRGSVRMVTSLGLPKVLSCRLPEIDWY
jgi:hypothetical protein